MDDQQLYAPALSEEVIRKLRLATSAETKEDLEIVCGEVFSDITGVVDAQAQDKLGIKQGCCFYEILAPYYLKVSVAAEALLHICRKLWHQPFIASIYALLLHRWLLLKEAAGGLEQRQKHVNVLVMGARDLFFGDVHGCTHRFAPLFGFLAYDVALAMEAAPLGGLPQQSRSALLELVAAFLPYYGEPQALAQDLARFPSPTVPSGGPSTSQDHEGTDFALAAIGHVLHKIRSESGMLRCLVALRALAGSEVMEWLRPTTRMMLHYELFVLTKPGGPAYVPPSVHPVASQTLDALFPQSRHSRQLVHTVFSLWMLPLRIWSSASGSAVRLVSGILDTVGCGISRLAHPVLRLLPLGRFRHRRPPLA